MKCKKKRKNLNWNTTQGFNSVTTSCCVHVKKRERRDRINEEKEERTGRGEAGDVREGNTGNVEQWQRKHERAEAPHPSASWMLTFTRFAAPRSSETHREETLREGEGKEKRRITNSLQKQSKLQNPLINLFSPCAYSNVSFPAGRGDSDTFLYLRALRNRKLFQKQHKQQRVKEKWQGNGDKQNFTVGF